MERPPSPSWRTIARLIRADLRARYRLATKPARVTLGGIELQLDDRWVTPPIHAYIYRGWYEDTERRILEQTLRPSDRVLELGAGLGFITACASQIVGSENVVAYEAIAELAELAATNCRLNGVSPTIINAVLGDHEDVVEFQVDEGEFWRSARSPMIEGATRRVAQRSFQGELSRLKPTYLVVDIEGGEAALLGDLTLPDHVRAICVETHPQVAGDDATQRMLMKLMTHEFVLDLGVSGGNVAFLARA